VRRNDRRWVGRNTDKPHRCPECHAVATWDHKRYGPRTVLVCPRDCGVRWRAGNRMKTWGMAFERYLRRVVG
jgi:hypothetical protein